MIAIDKSIYRGRPIRRILIVKWSALGDVAMATAIMEDVRQAFPKARIDVNTMPAYQQLFADDNRFENIISLDLRKKGQKLKAFFSWLKAVRHGDYDLVLDLQSNDRTWLMFSIWRLSTIRPPVFVGHHKRFPYKFAPPKQKTPPRGIDGLQRMLRKIEIVPSTNVPVIKFSQEREARVGKLLHTNRLAKKSFLILVPGSQTGGHLKRWGARNYADLASEVWNVYNLPSCIVGGPDEIEECSRVHAWAPEATINLCGKTAVLDLVPLGNKALAVIANDTGPAHILSACRKPMISICGPTDPKRVKPLGHSVATLQSPVDCRNCYLKECPNDHICMKNLGVDQVLDCLIRFNIFPR